MTVRYVRSGEGPPLVLLHTIRTQLDYFERLVPELKGRYRVRRVVSLNPYDDGESFGGGIRRSSNGWMVGMFRDFGSDTFDPRFVTAAVLRGGFHDAARLPDELLDEFSRAGSRDGYRNVEYSVFKNWTTWLEARKLYPRVKVPVTLIYGSDDRSRPEERSRNREAIPGSELFTINHVGYFTSLERPAEVAERILSQRTS